MARVVRTGIKQVVAGVVFLLLVLLSGMLTAPATAAGAFHDGSLSAAGLVSAQAQVMAAHRLPTRCPHDISVYSGRHCHAVSHGSPSFAWSRAVTPPPDVRTPVKQRPSPILQQFAIGIARAPAVPPPKPSV
jgi:hypothetical protein